MDTVARRLVAGLIALSCVCSLPAIAAAQDQGQSLALLDVRMTTPSAALWLTPVRPVSHERGAVLPALYVSLIALEAYDGYSTNRGLERGAIESNTLVSRLAANPTVFWAVKGGATLVSIYVAERLWRQNRRGRAIAVMIALNGLMAAVAVQNASVLRPQN